MISRQFYLTDIEYFLIKTEFWPDVNAVIELEGSKTHQLRLDRKLSEPVGPKSHLQFQTFQLES